MDDRLKNEILRGEELIWFCQDLQSEKDGVDRPKHHEIDKSKTLDQFAIDIGRSAVYMVSLLKLYPMQDKLAKIGRKLESDGVIRVDYGEDYSEAAIEHLLKQHGLKES
jgi:hypothetical protein